MISKTSNSEILFIAGSSKDRRGKRVLIREVQVENYLWPGDELTDDDAKILGLTQQDRRHIALFFGNDKRGG